jgi:hypothetical protein
MGNSTGQLSKGNIAGKQLGSRTRTGKERDSYVEQMG